MGTGNFTDDFKRDAVAQITERGYPAKDRSTSFGSGGTERRRARGRAAASGVPRRDRMASPGCTKACGPSVSTVRVERARVMAT